MKPESILSALEARVLGCLIEKELTTPDVYPLTLNALVNACSQKNNRYPVMDVTARDVELALEGLRNKQLVTHFSGADSRVAKFKQKIDNVYPMGTVERALLGELLLRGAQTTAGLRGNSERMVAMPPLEELEAILVELTNRPAGALTRKLARQPGQKEARWVQLLTGEPSEASLGESGATSGQAREPLAVTVAVALPAEAEKRIAALEADVASLKAELAKLRGALGG
jgi:uncharacterized protein YceH (UPF0502 family)